MPATTACAESGRRPARVAAAPRRAEAALRLRLPEFRRHRCRTFLLPGARSPRLACMLPNTIEPDSACMRRNGGLRDCRRAQGKPWLLTDRPHKRRLAAGRRLHIHGDVAAAAGSQAFEQSLKNFCAGGMIIGDIGHQLPCLLPDFESAAGLADICNIVLRVEQRAQECRKVFCSSFASREAARDLVSILHPDQLAGEVQQVAGIVGPNSCTMTGAAVRTYSIAAFR